jgi:chaperonin GroEL
MEFIVSNKYSNGRALSEAILRGADVLADNVASTLGPKGRTVILQEKNKNPVITKDGVSVAVQVVLDDPFENLGAQIIKQASQQTAAQAGDGTTTSIVLARALLREAQKYIISGISPIEIKRGMDKTLDVFVGKLKDISVPISSEEDIEHIATISANNDKSIGKLIATAVDKVGKDGSITIEEARSLETSLDVVEGFRFDSGYLATAFINDERQGVVKYDDPYILVTDHKFDSVNDMLPVLELIAREGKPFVLVAEEIEGQALAALIMNAMRGTMKVAAVKAPRYGEERRNILKDLAISIGATFVSMESGMKMSDVKLKDFGRAKKIEIGKALTTIVGGKGNMTETDARIDAIKAELAQTESMYECERLQERITRLASGIAIIRVGSATEIEMIEKKHRIEDALEAVRSAQQEGIVPGGGVALLRASKGLQIEIDNEEQKYGIEIVLRAIQEPLRQMAINAGESPDIIVSMIENLTDEKIGYDFLNRRLVNMIEEGIIDPVKVTRCALQNAISSVGTLITTNYAIVQI